MTSDEVRGLFPILEFFEFEHLPEHLQKISKPLHDIAWDFAWALANVENRQEVAAGLRKLLEAKDCFVRARL